MVEIVDVKMLMKINEHFMYEKVIVGLELRAGD